MASAICACRAYTHKANTPQSPKMQTKIAYYRNLFIGDSIIALDSLYAIKALYPNAFLVVYTGDIGVRIFSKFDFIDEIVNIQNLSKEQIIKSLDSKEFDYLILTQPNRRHTSIASASNAKVIISYAMWHNIFRRFWGNIFSTKIFGKIFWEFFGSFLGEKIFSKVFYKRGFRQFKRVFYSVAFGSTPNYKRLLSLVREIDAPHYDSSKIDFTPARFPPSPTHIEFVKQNLKIPKGYKILINPYSNSSPISLTPQGYATLATTLAKALPQAQIIISSFEGAPKLPLKSDSLNSEGEAKNIHIFKNNHDLGNLIELVRSVDLLISPSTGTIHIADNLGIKIIGLYSKRDMRLWLGKNMDKSSIIVLKTHYSKLKRSEESKIIETITQKTIEIINGLKE